MREYEKKLTDTKKRIEKYVFHPYLRQYIISPVIDEDKLLILISILDKLELSPHEKETFVVAIMLMQVALDTHDHVTNTLIGESSQKIRQLTVLAGDYYSGLYYKFLAEIGDIQIIRSLSEGVKNINEQKVFVYNKNHSDIDSLMNSVKMIEFSLIEKLTGYFGIKEWNESTSNLLLVKRLIKEKKQFEQAGTSVVFDSLERLILNCEPQNQSSKQKKYLLLACDRYIEYANQLIEKGMNKVPRINYLLEERMSEIIGQYHPRAKSFAEEG